MKRAFFISLSDRHTPIRSLGLQVLFYSIQKKIKCNALKKEKEDRVPLFSTDQQKVVVVKVVE